MTQLDEYFRLIDAYNQADGSGKKRLVDEIHSRFGITRTVIALDMSGFTRIVRRYGSVHYMAMIRRMQLLTRRVMEDKGGFIFDYTADNLSGSFEDLSGAIDGVIEIFAAIERDNLPFAASRRIRTCAGIATSDILWIPGYGAYGDAVNVAHKLGEDLAEPGEILIAESEPAALPCDLPYPTDQVTYIASGVEIRAQRIFVS